MNTKRKRSVIKKQTEKDAFVAILILMIGIFGAIMALIHTAAQDWNQLLVHYENSGLTRYNGQCTQTFVRENMLYRSSSADSIYLELVNGICVEIGTDCLDGALAG